DEVILVDDCSTDQTVEIARALNISTVIHQQNRGYGGNQKTCYQTALERGADIVVMVHPDYQYEPRLVTALASIVSSGVYDAALASRILGKGALAGGMPVYKYIANRFLTLFQNILMNAKLSEFHTGFRAFSREVLVDLPLDRNSNDFIFDNEMLAQILGRGFLIGEISCPTRYFKDASSINLRRSIQYGLQVLKVSVLYRAHKMGIYRYRILKS
ncbi:glycosyltransferase family 2 protein, partial [Pseudomonadota bacterium]